MEKKSKMLTLDVKEAEIIQKYEVAKVFWDTLYIPKISFLACCFITYPGGWPWSDNIGTLSRAGTVAWLSLAIKKLRPFSNSPRRGCPWVLQICVWTNKG